MSPNPGSITKPFRFLDLPPEIRNKIYVLLCISPDHSINLSDDLSYSSEEPIYSVYPHNLLFTNTQIYHEIRPVYFQCNAFHLHIYRRNEQGPFLLPSFIDNRRHIRTLHVTVWRWGAKDFFCRQLVPILEDCILNGSLREIEVAVKDGFEKWLGKRERPGEEFENWRRLSQLLRDPYLERVKLFEGIYTVCKDENGFDVRNQKDITGLVWAGKFGQKWNYVRIVLRMRTSNKLWENAAHRNWRLDMHERVAKWFFTNQRARLN